MRMALAGVFILKFVAYKECLEVCFACYTKCGVDVRQVFFDGAFAYVVGNGQSFDCGVVYDNFFYAVFLAV